MTDAVSLIKEHLGLAALVGRYTQLQRKGNRLAARCPFHSEKTPSFYVDEQKGLFHCFGCGKGGDLIQFARDIENLSFVEALDFLAEIAGIDLPKHHSSGPGRDVIEALRSVYQDATAFYHRQLARHESVRGYFQERQIRESTINLFKLGYAPSQWDALLEHLSPKHEAKILGLSGLFKTGQSGKRFDLFRDRVIFPIYDTFGHVIAFGGRRIVGEEGPKYINSPETPLYTKGRHLYNLHLAKTYLKKKPEVVVVEGYTDAIQVYQAGIGGVIASLGTAFTPEQAKLLKRYANKALLNFDADAAGFKAARASIETCLRLDLEVGVITLPDGQDPDTFIKKHGPDAYRQQLGKAEVFFEYLLNYLKAANAGEDPSRGLSLIAQEMCQTLHHVHDAVVQDQYLKKLGSKLNIPGHVVAHIFEQKAAQPSTRAASKPRNGAVSVRFSKIEREFLFHVMHHQDFSSLLKAEHREVLPEILSRIFHDRPYVLDFIYHAEEDLEERLEAVPPDQRNPLREILFAQEFDEQDQERLEVLFPELLRQMLSTQVRLNKVRMSHLQPHQEEKIKELMRQNAQLMKQYHQL